VSVARPLVGKRILVTRARHQAGQLSAELAKLGAEAIEVPAIEIVPPESYGMLDTALWNLARFQWLIVTSVNSVRVIRERCADLNVSHRDFSHLKIAAVGAATARALEEVGFSVAVTPQEYVAEALLEALPEELSGNCVLIARVAIARDVIPEILRGRGAQVEIVEAYRTVIPEASIKRVAELFAGEPPDAATFTSSSTVTSFFKLLRAVGFNELPEGVRAISIGPITSQTLREHGWEPTAEANPHDVAGLVAATVQALTIS
jgi:uroporphyrinogen-III synthase